IRFLITSPFSSSSLFFPLDLCIGCPDGVWNINLNRGNVFSFSQDTLEVAKIVLHPKR
ncbi:hypothetical protein L9F63_016658, partial [Diploptera punctata]